MPSDFFARAASIERATGRRIGAARPGDEPLRFVPATGLAFAATDAAATDARTWTTHFLSLAGGDGALPPHLLDEIAGEDADLAPRRALLAPFHHRATALLFRSVHRCRAPEETFRLDDPWPTRIASLLAVQTEGPLEQHLSLLLAPLLLGPRSAASLLRAVRIVAARWLDDAPVVLRERTGARVPIEESSRARLGHARLGEAAVLGTTVDDRDARVTLVLGPLSPAAAASLSPDADGHRALSATLGWLADPAVEVQVVGVTAVAPLQLGRARLGTATLGRARSVRQREIRIDATHAPAGRQAHRPLPKEPACVPIPARSSSA